MPSPEYKGTKKQLNVWVVPETGEYLRKFAKSRGLGVGKALDLIVNVLRTKITEDDEGTKV